MDNQFPENVVVQVGQCGNQIGWRFWDVMLREYQTRDANADAVYDDSWATYFKNATVAGDCAPSSVRGCALQHPQARAVLIDMEENVVNQLVRSDVGRILFAHRQLLTDVSGSGNNWAVGYHKYGLKYRESVRELLRKEVEACDHLGSFTLLSSLGGGTGSGFGSCVLEILHDSYPKVTRIVSCVVPSAVDDVITSPYNSIFAMQSLTENADFILPVENAALARMAQRIDRYNIQSGHSSSKAVQVRPYGLMNGLVANMLVNLTASSRFSSGRRQSSRHYQSIPLPQLLTENFSLSCVAESARHVHRMPFLTTSVAPLPGQRSSSYAESLPRLDQLIVEVLGKPNQMLDVDVRRSVVQSCVFSMRSKVWDADDIQRCSTKVKRALRFYDPLPNSTNDGDCYSSSVMVSPAASSCSSTSSTTNCDINAEMLLPDNNNNKLQQRVAWNLCRQPPINKLSSITFVARSSAFRSVPMRLSAAFSRLYRRRAFAHHYAENGVEPSDFDSALSCAEQLIHDYTMLEQTTKQSELLFSTDNDMIACDRRVPSSTTRDASVSSSINRPTSAIMLSPIVDRPCSRKYATDVHPSPALSRRCRASSLAALKSLTSVVVPKR